MRWEIERDRFGVMFSGPLEVGECIEVVPASFTDEDVERVAEAIYAALEDSYSIERETTVAPTKAELEDAARRALSAYLETTTKGDT